MFEIYTPKDWYSVFSCPSIIVDNDGLIYNSTDYHKLLRNPIGKIDYKSGYIYGEDYCKLMPSPIGFIKKNGTVTMVFDKDYNGLNPTPIFYIKGNEIYSPDEYYKLFSIPSAYLKSDSAKNSNITTSSKNNNVDDSLKDIRIGDSYIVKILKTILVILAVAFVGVAFIYNTLTDDPVYVPVLLVAFFAGFAFSFVFCEVDNDSKAFGNICVNALFAEFVSVIVFWIGIMIIDLPGSHGFSMFGTIFLSPILIAVMMAVPSIIIGFIVYGVKKLLKN